MCKYFLILLYAFIGAVITWLTIERIVKPYIKKKRVLQTNDWKDYLREVPWVVFFSGFFEIVLYGGSFLTGKPEFIVVWIGFKTALRWDRKIKSTENISDTERRGLYHSNLLGTALNIIFGFIAACLVRGEFITFQ